MILRGLAPGTFVLGAALGAIMFMGPALMFGAVKHDLSDAYEQAGMDMTECKKHPRTLLDPGGGMPDCLQDSFRDLSQRISGSSGKPGEK